MTKYFGDALNEVGKDWGGYIVGTLIYVLVTAGLGFIWIGGLVHGMFAVGYFYFVRKKITTGKADIADLFVSFKQTDLILPSILAGIVTAILTAVGFICVIIPGLFALAAFIFVYLIILDGEKDFWAAMMKSKDISAKDWGKYIVFAILAYLIIAAGGLVLGIGIIVTLPIGIASVVLLYEDLKKPAQVETPAENPIVKET